MHTPGVPVTPAPTPSSTATEGLLGMVPLEATDQIVWVADRGRLKALHGLEGVDLNVYLPDLIGSRETTLDFYKLIESTLMVSIPSYRRWGEYAFPMNENVGFSQLTFDREIWSDGQRYRTSSSPRPGSFFIGEGNVDERTISDKLLSLGYDEVAYGNITYLSNSQEDFGHDLTLPPGLEFGQMNRVYQDDDRLIAASSTDRLTDILHLQLNDAPTLAHSTPHAALSQQLGKYPLLRPHSSRLDSYKKSSLEKGRTRPVMKSTAVSSMTNIRIGAICTSLVIQL